MRPVTLLVPLRRSCPEEHSSVAQKNLKTPTKIQARGFYFESHWLTRDKRRGERLKVLCELARLSKTLTNSSHSFKKRTTTNVLLSWAFWPGVNSHPLLHPVVT